MMLLQKRMALLFVFSLAGLLLAACGGGDDVVARPEVRLEVGERTYETEVYSYCWPVASDNLVCHIDESARVQPDDLIAIGQGEDVRFVITGDAGEPQNFRATLLDGQGGVEDFGGASEGVYPAALSDGTYRIQVDAEYADIEGQPAYVSYVFGVEIAGRVAMATPTPTPTQTPEPTATQTPTDTPAPTDTPPPTATDTPVPTATQTPVPTEPGEPVAEARISTVNVRALPTLDADSVGTISPGETFVILGQYESWYQIEFSGGPDGSGWVSAPLINVAGDEAAIPLLPAPAGLAEADAQSIEPTTTLTADIPTPSPAPTLTPLASATPVPGINGSGTGEQDALPGDLGEVVLSGTVTTSASDRSPIPGATVIYTHTSTVAPERSSSGTAITAADGSFSFAPIMINASDSVRLSVTAPGYQSEDWERTGQGVVNAGGLFDFALTPLVINPPLTPPTPDTAGPGAPDDVPDLRLVLAGRSYTPVGYQYCVRQPAGERRCVELPGDAAPAARLDLPRGAAVQLQIGGPRPQQVVVEYLTDTGIRTGQPEALPGDNLLLLTITPEPGSYIMAVRVTWAQEEATYYLRVAVTD